MWGKKAVQDKKQDARTQCSIALTEIRQPRLASGCTIPRSGWCRRRHSGIKPDHIIPLPAVSPEWGVELFLLRQNPDRYRAPSLPSRRPDWLRRVAEM